MKQIYCSRTELWYPYSEPRVAHENQGAAEGADNRTNRTSDCSNPPRLGGLVLGS